MAYESKIEKAEHAGNDSGMDILLGGLLVAIIVEIALLMATNIGAAEQRQTQLFHALVDNLVVEKQDRSVDLDVYQADGGYRVLGEPSDDMSRIYNLAFGGGN